MRLSGVDPSIIRELSGIYKPFVKAFKEIISNAYDADATTIIVSVARDFSSIVVQDNGIGLTPIEFHRDFTRLGGSTAWRNQGRSPGGRPRIGYKGIGFLAVARYCSRMEVESNAPRFHRDMLALTRGRRRALDVSEVLAALVPAPLLRPRLKIEAVEITDGVRRVRLKRGYDYTVAEGVIRLRSKRALAATDPIQVRYALDCRDLMLRASLDFDYLLGLERKADLHLLENFCDVVVTEREFAKAVGTRIRLVGLKEFVVRDLAAPRHRGKGWHISSRAGKDQFLWRLARAAPIRDALPAETLPMPLERLRKIEGEANVPRLFVRWRDDAGVELTRPVYLPSSLSELEDSIVPVEIDEGGLRAVGYLLAQSELVYPAELRGISVRVRNVAIGDPWFFGLERTLAGARKAALSQIGGEVLVLEGLDSAEAINPGRESFYEEHPHYRILRRALIGTEDALGGAVGRAIRLITDRSNVRSQVTQKIGAARTRRKVLTDLSSAVHASARSDAAMARRIGEFLALPLTADGLAKARDIVVHPVARIAGFEVEAVSNLPGEFSIDFAKRRVTIDFSRDIWSHSVYLGGKYYEVFFKQGAPGDPICEFDNATRRIYVNWAHPIKSYMDEYAFLRSSIVWRFAYHVAPDQADMMINLALNLLAHRAE